MRATRKAAVVFAAVLAGAPLAVTLTAPVSDAQTHSKETLDQYFKLEWSKNGSKVNGYVYNSSNRRAVRMQLLVEGVDASGAVLAKTTTWLRDVPPNNRAYFDVGVKDAPAYRVSILTFDWVDDRDQRRPL